ncbi:MAG: alpha/beta fold hydrolase [Sphingobium sp.]|nr:alpha/beta fold hydrolase [Sphingobium sp.]
MASFLLIHGAWHGGWCFDRLVPLLEAKGHVVAAPTLPRIGGTDLELAGASLEEWAAFIVEQARALPGPVILVGHSRAGIAISAAAERDPDAFAALVYLTAFLVPPGQSMGQVRESFPRDPAFDGGISEAARGAALAISQDAAIPTFYGDCGSEDQLWAASQLVPEPLGPMVTPLALSDARYGSVPRHYIECTLDAAIPLAQQRAMQQALPCASVTTLVSAHSPFLSMPDKLADVLDSIAERI